jgi:hypothetical protein
MDEEPVSVVHQLRNALISLGVVVGLVWICQRVSLTSDASLRLGCKNNLKQIGLAMHNYHDTYGSFPPAYIADENGRPMHSWRVLLLPFLGQRKLYDSYRFDEPWSGPHNRQLAAQIPAVYRCPADEYVHPGSTDTSYMVIVGPQTVFPDDRPLSISQIPDGTTDTAMVVESIDAAVNWIQPTDLDVDMAINEFHPRTGPGISSHHEPGVQMCFCDGSVRLLSEKTDVELLRCFIERCDGKILSIPSY